MAGGIFLALAADIYSFEAFVKLTVHLIHYIRTISVFRCSVVSPERCQTTH